MSLQLQTPSKALSWISCRLKCHYVVGEDTYGVSLVMINMKRWVCLSKHGIYLALRKISQTKRKIYCCQAKIKQKQSSGPLTVPILFLFTCPSHHSLNIYQPPSACHTLWIILTVCSVSWLRSFGKSRCFQRWWNKFFMYMGEKCHLTLKLP